MTMHDLHETITAISTPAGRGGVGIVRVSGPLSKTIGQNLTGIQSPQYRHAYFCDFIGQHGAAVDQGIVLFYQAPNSFTGEDVVEFQGHGSRVVLDMVLQATIAYGARLARPGEFSERAFLNDKLDLAQAEAIADLIDSDSEQAARSALRSLQGEFSHQIQSLLSILIELRSYVEAAIDFVDEDIDFLSNGQVESRLLDLEKTISSILAKAKNGVLLREGMKVVIAGPPNAGKSSLMNYLAGSERAIVTDIAGTTRDVLMEHIALDGLPLHIVDTAGLHESDDIVEQIGMKRAQDEIEQADLLLLVFDDSDFESGDVSRVLSMTAAQKNKIIIRNKIDISGADAGIVTHPSHREVYVSIKNRMGLNVLTELVKEFAGFHSASEDSFIARRRHVDALTKAKNAIKIAITRLQSNAPELLAEELSQSQNYLSMITGEFTNEDLLGNIFSSFCIGK